jgi:hypothetical protein
MQAHNSILDIAQEVQRQLKADLSESQREVLDIVLSGISAGEGRISLLEISSERQPEEYFKTLIELAKANLIRLEVTT